MDEAGTRWTPGGTKVWLLALSTALLAWALLVARFDFLCDDAYITFRYARHLAEGHGLRFNPGESPPVEGYTNFLWVLWLGLFERLGADPGVVSRATSIACGAALIALATRVAVRRLALDLPSAIAVALFLACLPPMSLWSTSGLEAMPFALAVFATWERLSAEGSDRSETRIGADAGAFALAAAFLRADGALWAGIAILAAAASRPRCETRARARSFLLALAILAASVGAHLLWRHAYYGEWLPNTARVKAGFSAMRLERGAKYVASFGLEVLPFALVPAGCLLLIRRARNGLLAAGFVVLLLAAAYAVHVGGDFMPMGRFLLPAMPFLAILLAELLVRIGSARRVFAVASACTALALLPSFDVHLVPRAVRECFHFRWNDPEPETEVAMWRGMRERAEQWAVLGRALAAHTQPRESIILGNIGAIGYFTDLEILDPFGLVDPEVARRDAPLVRASPGHDKAVPFEHFFPRRPTYLNAWLARTDSPPEVSMPGSWLALLRSGRVELRRVPLEADAGFPRGIELRLLRFRWDV